MTPKFTRWLLIALVGYAAFALINMVLVWTGVLGPFTLATGLKVYVNMTNVTRIEAT